MHCVRKTKRNLCLISWHVELLHSLLNVLLSIHRRFTKLNKLVLQAAHCNQMDAKLFALLSFLYVN